MGVSSEKLSKIGTNAMKDKKKNGRGGNDRVSNMPDNKALT
ncbi:MAG: hypothetical protein RO257_03050 [Candidatus Kapabacteria bacterium]|nr:hypothetical protein [Candidatus Kapabacteria bacterium]